MSGFTTPSLLLLLPVALLPLVTSVLRSLPWSAVALVPADPLSRVLAVGLTACACLALGALVVGLAGPYGAGVVRTRIGTGAHVMLVVDRSASMNQDFAGQDPERSGSVSKAATAARLLRAFTTRRPHDTFGVIAFATMPMLAMPLTDHSGAVRAAIAATDRPGLGRTAIGRALLMAFTAFKADPGDAPRTILLVSDGATVIGRKTQEHLRAAFVGTRIHLYWLFLRTAGGDGPFTLPDRSNDDTPQAMPARHLNLFFESLKVPYHAFEAENPGAVAEAIKTIGALETRSVLYHEHSPRHDLSGLAYGIALGAILILMIAKAVEVGSGVES